MSNPNEPNSGSSRNPSNPHSFLSESLNQLASGYNELNQQNRANIMKMAEEFKSEIETGDEDGISMALFRLSDLLSIANEDSLSGFRVDTIAPSLVNLLHFEHNPEIMLVAARCLTYLMEYLPNSVDNIVENGAVPLFCNNLVEISYIDLAEQSLQALDKISNRYGHVIMKEGGLAAIMMLLDFLNLRVKRSAVSTVANMCKRVQPDHFDRVQDVIGQLTILLNDSDAKVAESACLAFARLADQFGDNEEKLKILAREGLVQAILQNILSAPPATLGLLLRLSCQLCQGSSDLTVSFLGEGVGPLLNVLCTSDEKSVPKSPEQISQILMLINEILPPLPKEILPPSASNLNINSQLILSGYPIGSLAGRGARMAGLSLNAPRSDEKNAERAEFLVSRHGEMLASMNEILLPCILKIYTSTINTGVHLRCLSCVTKMMNFSMSEALTELLSNITISSFLATALSAKSELPVLAIALKISEILMKKLPDIFKVHFRREGVFYQIEKLASGKELEAIPPPASLPKKASPSTRLVQNLSATPLNPGEMVVDLVPSQSSSQSTTAPVPIPGSPNPSSRMNQESSPSSSPSMLGFSPVLSNSLKDMIFLNSAIPSKVDELKNWIETQAKVFEEKYINICGESGSAELAQLKKACEQLVKFSENPVSSHEETEAIKKIADLFSSEKGVSPFEILQSQFITSLLRFLVYADPNNDDEDARARRRARVSLFVSHFGQERQNNGDESKVLPIRVLVKQLQETLVSCEKFPLFFHNTTGSGSSISYLIQPFKLRFQRDPNDSNSAGLKDISTSLAHIEPLAVVDELHSFLKNKLLSEDKPLSTNPSKGTPEASKLVSSVPSDISESDSEYSDNFEDFDPQQERIASNNVVNLSLSTDEACTGSQTLKPAETSKSEEKPSGDKSLKLILHLGKVKLDINSLTIFQYIQKFIYEKCNGNVEQYQSAHQMWDEVYTITYKKDSDEDEEMTDVSNENNSRGLFDSPLDQFFSTSSDSLLSSTTGTNIKASIEGEKISYQLLDLLKVIDAINKSLFSTSDKKDSMLHPSEFVNEKLTSKLMRQLQVPLTPCSGSLPEWCQRLASIYPFILPFECRRSYFSSTSFGIARAIQCLQQRIEATLNERGESLRLPRIQRQKVRVYRNRIFDSAIKVMSMFGQKKAIIEVEYFGEVGTGLGPTMEFYTLVCEESQRKDLNIWIDESEKRSEKMSDASEGVHVLSPFGLFPSPKSSHQLSDPESKMEKKHSIEEIFKFLGTFIAKALLDGRILDLPFSPAFYKRILGYNLCLSDLKDVTSNAKFIYQLYSVSKKKKALLASNKIEDCREEILKAQTDEFQSIIEDLCINFTIPGFSDYELKENGRNITLTIDNVEEYVELVTNAYLKRGVEKQFEKFTEGFNEVFSINCLRYFTPSELETLICGNDPLAKWDIYMLRDNILCDHGYSIESRVVKFLLEILSEFDLDQQREFLRFVTGTPRLPIGGFKNLQPKMTIVRKDVQPSDSFLPSVSSCFHFLKLPEYSSKEITCERLLYAIKCGQGSFDFN